MPTCWLFDPKRREGVAFGLSGGVYRQVASAREREVFAAPPCAELAIPLASVWE